MDYKMFYKRKLPHYQPLHSCLFVTLRLAFDIPERYLYALAQYRESLKREHEKDADQMKAREIAKKLVFAREDDIYNECSSEIDLCRDPAAQIVSDKLQAMQEDYYYLYAYTIMPNHIHMLIKALEKDGTPVSLSEIMKSFKGSTARNINKALNREGTLWFREYFDHWVRSQQELVNVIEYIRNNPVKAGLAVKPGAWRWTWIHPQLLGE